jgi:hypothetical protein
LPQSSWQNNKPSKNQRESRFQAELLNLFFDPEDGSDMFPLNVVVFQWITSRYITEDGALHKHRRENLRSLQDF